MGRLYKQEYALYKGEEMLAVGTIKEIAEQLGIAPDTVRYYSMPAYFKKCNGKMSNRRVLVKIDEGDDDIEDYN